MGILNVTPDSFSDGGNFYDLEAAVEHGLQLAADGADIIDIGGESTRPGATPVAADEELRRVLPVIAALRAKTDVLLSIDTCKPTVAAVAIDAGARIINDVRGFGRDNSMLEIVKKTGAGIVCMHMRGTPAHMQDTPQYFDVVAEVRAFFEERLAALIAFGLDPQRVVFDPGIGFGKTLEHNLSLLRHLPALRVADRPILLGVSRKSFIGKIVGTPHLQDRSAPTVAVTAWGLANGAEIHRVHEVKANVQALRMMEAIRG